MQRVVCAEDLCSAASASCILRQDAFISVCQGLLPFRTAAASLVPGKARGVAHSGKTGRLDSKRIACENSRPCLTKAQFGLHMLLRQGDSRTDSVDRRLGWTLAGIAGALNTAAFHAVGFFAANMTGNVSLVSNHAASGGWQAAFFVLFILLLFICGAAFATSLANAGHRLHISGVYAIGILLEALLMALLGTLCLQLSSSYETPVLVLGLSFLMGLQNALVTRISNARVRTTHVSGMSTDIGIELAMLVDMKRGAEPARDISKYSNRFWLHSQTLIAFLIGGVFGAFLYQTIGLRLLHLAAVLLFVMASVTLLRNRRNQRLKSDVQRPAP